MIREKTPLFNSVFKQSFFLNKKKIQNTIQSEQICKTSELMLFKKNNTFLLFGGKLEQNARKAPISWRVTFFLGVTGWVLLWKSTHKKNRLE